MLAREIAVGIPTAVEYLNVSHSALGETAGIETAGGESSGLAGLLTIEGKGGFLLSREIHELWN